MVPPASPAVAGHHSTTTVGPKLLDGSINRAQWRTEGGLGISRSTWFRRLDASRRPPAKARLPGRKSRSSHWQPRRPHSSLSPWRDGASCERGCEDPNRVKTSSTFTSSAPRSLRPSPAAVAADTPVGLASCDDRPAMGVACPAGLAARCLRGANLSCAGLTAARCLSRKPSGVEEVPLSAGAGPMSHDDSHRDHAVSPRPLPRRRTPTWAPRLHLGLRRLQARRSPCMVTTTRSPPAEVVRVRARPVPGRSGTQAGSPGGLVPARSARGRRTARAARATAGRRTARCRRTPAG